MSETTTDDGRPLPGSGSRAAPIVAGRSSPAIWVAASCPIVVGLCVAFVDRAAASLSHADFGGRDQVFVALTHIVDPLLPLAALVLAAAAVAAILGRPLSRAARVLLACALAVAIAYLFREELKYAFGRVWPETWVQNNPSWIRDGAYGFFPFHGGTGWSSFPSGHMTIVAAPAAALWMALPRWRVVVTIPVALVAIGLYGADYHFVGDIVAGTYLGAACGAGAWALVRRSAPESRAA